MDKNKLKKICQMALDTSYSGVKITTFAAIPTYRYDVEKNEWVPDSHSCFILLKKPTDQVKDFSGIENYFESLLGLECCIDFS